MIRARQRNTQLQHQILWYLLTSQNGKDVRHLEMLLADAKQARLPAGLFPAPLPAWLLVLIMGDSSILVSLLLIIQFHKTF